MKASEAKALVAKLDERDACPACGHSGPVSELGCHWPKCELVPVLLLSMDEDDDG
jgi:hypothetical protein